MQMVHHHRRGGIYVAVLGASVIVALIGMTALATLRSQRLAVTTSIDAAKARLYADSAAEIGMQMIAADSNWRNDYASGSWITKQAIDDGTFSLSVTDPIDNNLANRPTDSILVTGTGMRGNATQIVQGTMVARGTPLDALAMALTVAGDLHVAGSQTLTVQGAPASTNTTLSNQGTVAGDVQCFISAQPGTVTGTLTIISAAKAMPASGVEAMYVGLGTAINPGTTMDRVVLSPGVNPYGGTNTDGLYVITTSSDITIRRSRINGTLVIVCPGHTVTIKDNVFIQPARSDYPALIIDGNAKLQVVSTSQLSESTEGTNFNPAGAPYLGVTDSDQSDSYPSEIDGLVHVKGTLSLDQSTLVRGAVICESTTASKAVDVISNVSIIYDPTLYSSPPMGYTKSVTMSLKAGSWKQVVLP